MKKKRNFALGRHSITPLGQLYRRSQIHEPKAIKLQQIQFYICRIKHIWYTHEETTLHCPEELLFTENHLVDPHIPVTKAFYVIDQFWKRLS